MQLNHELTGRLSQIYAMFETGDATAAESLVSQEQGVLGIGTDPNEWWEGSAFIRAIHAQIPEMSTAGMRFQQGNVQAFSEGSVGWLADQPTLRLSNGGEVPMRLTSVWHQEAGDWKVVQLHLSIGALNQETIGEELTV